MAKKTAAGASESPNAEAPAVDATPTPSVSATDVGALASVHLDEAPAVQPHAVAQALADKESAALLDKSGAAFNPAIHEAGADGTGEISARGLWKAKRGRKSGPQSARTPGKLIVPGTTKADSDAEKRAGAMMGGKVAANMMIISAMMLGGDEWQPRIDEKAGINERAILEEAFGEYFHSKGWEDLPPGWALVAACGMYALPRFQMPKTQEKARGVKSWIVGKFAEWKKRRELRKWENRETTARREADGQSAIERADRDARNYRAQTPKVTQP
jgi:hypothetical protein